MCSVGFRGHAQTLHLSSAVFLASVVGPGVLFMRPARRESKLSITSIRLFAGLEGGALRLCSSNALDGGHSCPPTGLLKISSADQDVLADYRLGSGRQRILHLRSPRFLVLTNRLLGDRVTAGTLEGARISKCQERRVYGGVFGEKKTPKKKPFQPGPPGARGGRGRW